MTNKVRWTQAASFIGALLLPAAGWAALVGTWWHHPIIGLCLAGVGWLLGGLLGARGDGKTFRNAFGKEFYQTAGPAFSALFLGVSLDFDGPALIIAGMGTAVAAALIVSRKKR